MGSRAFSAVARAVLYVVEDQENREIKVLGQPKNNLGRSDLPDLAYSLHQVTTGMWEDEIITSVALKWEGERVSGTIRTMLNTKTGTKTKAEMAADWLENYLTENGKSLSKQVKQAAEFEGLNERTLQRARTEIQVIVTLEGFGKDKVSYWSLPTTIQDHNEIEGPWDIESN
jgi:hypothetical protein